MTNHNILTKENASIIRTDFYLVSVKSKNGEGDFEGLEPRRLFPVNAKRQYIALVDANEKEMALIKDLADLDDASEKAVTELLDDIYRIPKITRIKRFTDRGRLIWYCETDKGDVHFHIHRIRQDIRFLGKRVLIRDYLDNRYEIPDYTKLDKTSLKILNTFT
ncbi:MAG: DUF1854 domain-containing protein [Clostridia bacterium]|nr:DUF1854 domain-containing protein [Clostridia bacterium]